MANLLVLLEIHKGAVLPVSLEALGQARCVATALGATVYALVPLPEAPAYGEDDIIATCARYGADKVVLLTDEGLLAEEEMRFGTHGRAILAACQQLPPAVLLAGATPGARDVAPRLAARLGAIYLAEGFIGAQKGRLHLWDHEGRPLSALEPEAPNIPDGAPDAEAGRPAALEHTVVLTVPPGRYRTACSEDEAEMVIVAAPPGQRDFVQVSCLPQVAVTVVGDEGTSATLLQVLCDGAAQCASGTAPALVVALSAPFPQTAGAVRVAIGPQALSDPHAHYAWAPSDEELQRVLLESSAQTPRAGAEPKGHTEGGPEERTA